MSVPSDRKYLKSHEWHLAEGDMVTIGVTQIAADELTDVTYVSLPRVGAQIQAGGQFGEIESVKTTSELYSAVGGEVTAVNAELSNNPGLVNTDPYTQGWMIKIKVTDEGDSSTLLSSEAYVKQSGH